MSFTAQKIQAKGTIPTLNALTQVVIPAANLGLRLKEGSRPPITSVLAEKGAKYNVNEATGELTIYNDSPENLTDIRVVVFSDHTVERDNKPDIVIPAPVPYGGAAIGASIPSADFIANPGELGANGRIQFLNVRSSLGTAITVDPINLGRFTINESGDYRFRCEIQGEAIESLGTATLDLTRVSDPAGLAVLSAERRAWIEPGQAGDLAEEDLLTIDAADPAINRTFEYRLAVSEGIPTVGFAGQTQRAGHLVIERVG